MLRSVPRAKWPLPEICAVTTSPGAVRGTKTTSPSVRADTVAAGGDRIDRNADGRHQSRSPSSRAACVHASSTVRRRGGIVPRRAMRSNCARGSIALGEQRARDRGDANDLVRTAAAPVIDGSRRSSH